MAIFRGLSQDIGPVNTSKVYAEQDIELSDLPSYQQDRVRADIAANDLTDARRIVTTLRRQAEICREVAAKASRQPQLESQPDPAPRPRPPRRPAQRALADADADCVEPARRDGRRTRRRRTVTVTAREDPQPAQRRAVPAGLLARHRHGRLRLGRLAHDGELPAGMVGYGGGLGVLVPRWRTSRCASSRPTPTRCSCRASR